MLMEWGSSPVAMEHPESLRTSVHWKTLGDGAAEYLRNRIKKALDADCIVSTSNDGWWPSIWYLNRLRMDPRNAILLTGYQAVRSEVECY